MTEVDDLGTLALQDATHDVDGSIVSVEQTGCRDQSDFGEGCIHKRGPKLPKNEQLFIEFRFGFGEVSYICGMHPMTQALSHLYKQWSGAEPTSIDLLPESGSERRYFRLHGANGTVIGTYGDNIRENETFQFFTQHFNKKGLPVPEFLIFSDDKRCYLQSDKGDQSLLSLLEQEGETERVYGLFQKTVRSLAQLQVQGDANLDYTRCLTNQEFGKQAILADLLYFKYYFLDALRKPYDKQKLIDDFDALSNYLTHTEYKYFLFRDFQSRNILVKDEEVFFIDYQGGMKGAPQYDLASLLWQAKANLSPEWKEKLLVEYLDALDQQIGKSVNRTVFRSQYNGYVLIRLLQVLGAYGFRGLFERKAHFLTSIPLALSNLTTYLSKQSIGIALPEFEKVLQLCISEEIVDRFTPTLATEHTPLVVKICSFSYRGEAPKDSSSNGGGFVFDCRGIVNPGRVEEMKIQTGRDKPVKDYLEQQTLMPDFLNSVYDLVDITVEEYIKRGFESLMVSFGCTGGQHRSVYAADALARHLRNKFKVKVELRHMVQDAKNWINELPKNA
jgi:aminoglycoside/choline kinase family phosphotransferase